MKLYTGNGDSGFSTLSSGIKISKADERFEVLGSIDELVSFIANCRVIVVCPKLNGKLETIQKVLSSIASAITYTGKKEYLPTAKDLQFLEEQIDKTQGSFEMPTDFSLSGKCELSCRLDLARTVCRRLERTISALDKKYGVDGTVKKYVNRLSDLLFVYARRIDYDFENGNLSGISSEASISSKTQTSVSTEEIYREVLKRVGFGKQLTLETAQKLAKKVREKASEIGLNAVIAIANSQGRPILVEVMDDAFLVSFDVAIKKAYTSSAVKMSTAQLAKEVKEGGSLKGLETETSLIYLGGGEPLKAGWEVIGAIGVSGGTADQDSFLAEYGAKVFAEINA